MVLRNEVKASGVVRVRSPCPGCLCTRFLLLGLVCSLNLGGSKAATYLASTQSKLSHLVLPLLATTVFTATAAPSDRPYIMTLFPTLLFPCDRSESSTTLRGKHRSQHARRWRYLHIFYSRKRVFDHAFLCWMTFALSVPTQ